LSSAVSRTADPATLVPDIRVAAEHYNRVARMLEKGIAVTLEADIRNTYHPNPRMFNVVGEIRGTDLADEVVMIGAHFDSWHSGTGATDNVAGSAAMMEAMRILKQSGVPLRRTVRIGLWNGEEQGLNGSRDYVETHFASRAALPGGAGAAGARGGGRGGAQGPLEPKPAYAKFAGYFNIDNGTGAIRGVYLQGNEAVAPIFRAWMEPFRSIGMTHLTVRNTGGTDHQSFDGVGLPGFQFIQDGVEYNTVTHHYNMDTYERLQPEDMRKNATIAAAFAFLAANRAEKLPRKPMPAGGGRGRGGN
jgi:Zn-dependent M28 family amino/carboxypeptidase